MNVEAIIKTEYRQPQQPPFTERGGMEKAAPGFAKE